jgi:DNA-binding IclR family transcriptional regulator
MAHETRESYYLTILDGHEVIIIDRADNPEMWSIVARLGARSPVHATASGQVLIADLPEETLDRMIGQSGLKKFTAKTITNEVRLKKRLRAISVPIYDHNAKVVAALMTGIQSERKKKEEAISRIVRILKKEAAVISHAIGYVEVAA